MSNFTVLTDKTVHEILISLSKPDILTFVDKIATSLQDFSVGDERRHQPEPAVINRPDGRKTLFRSFTSATGVGVKIIVDPAAALAKEDGNDASSEAERQKMAGLHGVLALCDRNGLPVGFVNAEEITGYRTSVSAIILYVKRRRTKNIVVFGAGKQALWHLRLALALRRNEIERVSVVNRSKKRMEGLLEQIRGENGERWKAEVQFEGVLAGDEEGVERVLGEADVVFCTTPSKQVLFPARYLTGRKEGCYVSAIGSWQKDMIELDPQILREAAERGGSNGLVVADNRDDCVHSAGEVIQSGLGVDKIAEVGEILHLLAGVSSERQEKTRECLETGLVVYKSVGVSMTDLAAGQAVLEMARKKGQGVSIPDF